MKLTMSEDDMRKAHEICRQNFTAEIKTAREFLGKSNRETRYHLLRAGCAAASGLTYASILGITESGWFDRLIEIDKVWEVSEK